MLVVLRVAKEPSAAHVLVEELAVVDAKARELRSLRHNFADAPVLGEAHVVAEFLRIESIADVGRDFALRPAHHVSSEMFVLESLLKRIRRHDGAHLRPCSAGAVDAKQIAAGMERIAELGKLLFAAVRGPHVWWCPRRSSFPMHEKRHDARIKKLAILLNGRHRVDVRKVAVWLHVASAVVSFAAHRVYEIYWRVVHPLGTIRLPLEIRQRAHPVAVDFARLHPPAFVWA